MLRAPAFDSGDRHLGATIMTQHSRSLGSTKLTNAPFAGAVDGDPFRVVTLRPQPCIIIATLFRWWNQWRSRRSASLTLP